MKIIIGFLFCIYTTSFLIQLQQSRLSQSFLKPTAILFAANNCQKSQDAFQILKFLSDQFQDKFDFARILVPKNKNSFSQIPSLRIFYKSNSIEYTKQLKTHTLRQFLLYFSDSDPTPITEEQINFLHTHQVIAKVSTKEQQQIVALVGKSDQTNKYYVIQTTTQFSLSLINYDTTKYYSIQDSLTADNLLQFVDNHTKKDYYYLDSNRTIQKILRNKENKPVLMILMDVNYPMKKRHLILQYCSTKRLQLYCVQLTKNDQIYKEMQQFIDLLEKHKNTTVIVLFYDQMSDIFYYDKPYELHDLDNFVINALTGYLKPHIVKRKNQRSLLQFNHMPQLLDAHFHSIIQTTPLVFVFFTGRGCKKCINLIPHMDNLHTNNTNPNIKTYFVDLDIQTEIRSVAKVPMPAYRIYCEGQQLDYQQEQVDQQKIEQFIHKAYNFEIERIKYQDIPKRHPIIIGKLPLKGIRFLPYFLLNDTLYHVETEQNLHFQYHTQSEVHSYKGIIQRHQVLEWLVEVSTPVLSNLLLIEQSLRLLQAKKKNIPILAYINRDNNTEILSTMQGYCAGRKDITCGFVNRGQPTYHIFQLYFTEKEEEESRLAYLILEKNERYLYRKTLKNITPSQIDAFIREVREKKIRPLNDEKKKKDVKAVSPDEL